MCVGLGAKDPLHGIAGNGPAPPDGGPSDAGMETVDPSPSRRQSSPQRACADPPAAGASPLRWP